MEYQEKISNINVLMKGLSVN